MGRRKPPSPLRRPYRGPSLPGWLTASIALNLLFWPLYGLWKAIQHLLHL